MNPDPRTPVRSGAKSRLLVVAAIAAAAVWSVLRKGYQFDGFYADDQFWNALLVDRLHPGELAGDPLVQLIAGRYASGLFDLMTTLAPVVSLPVLSLALFAVARGLCCAAVYRLTVTLGGSAAAGVIGSFLTAGATISYFGGINFVETILTPRGFALPLALFGLDAFLRRRLGWMTVWLAACLYVHPVTGIDVLGVVAFCGICFPASAPRPALWSALAALAFVVVLLALRVAPFAGGAALRYDPAWAAVIAQTVGPWVYLHRLPPDFWWPTLWVPIFGGVALLFVPAQPLRAAALRFAAAVVAALALHALAVDWLDFRLLLQLAPQRASLALTAVCIAAVAVWIAASLRAADPLRRVLAAAFLAAAVLLRDPAIAGVFGLALALAWWLRRAALAPAVRAGLAAAVVVAVVVPGRSLIAASFHASPRQLQSRLARLATLGVDADWADVQRYIRRHSQVGDPVMAPPALSPRVFARRPSTLRTKMQSFTHMSREFAFEFAAWQRDVGIPLARADTATAIALARRTPARWLVLDDRDTPVGPRDPEPAYRAGPYRAYPLAPDVSPPDPTR